jgi:hypothetical protein
MTDAAICHMADCLLHVYNCVQRLTLVRLIMTDDNYSRSRADTVQKDVAPRKHLRTGMLLGWALFIFIVIMVAAGLSRAIVAELSADEINTDASSDTLNFTDAWIRATPPGATTAAAYVVIDNSGEDDRLLEVQYSHAGAVQIHTSSEQSGMMRMSQLDSLAIASGELVTLAPSGHHIMFMDITYPFVPGNTEILTLVFEKAGTREVSFTIIDPRSMQE